MSQSTIAEIKSGQSSNIFNVFQSKNNIVIINPELKYVHKIKKIVIEMGQNRLSEVDIEVLALALMLSENEVILISDDYGIKNIANELNIQTRGSKTKGGSYKRHYQYRCRACNTNYKQLVSDCDVCGGIKFNRWWT